MSTLQFNRKSWHSALYQSSYNTKELPDNICGYFWLLLFGIVMFPFSLAGHIINGISWLFRKKQYGSHICAHAIWTSVHIPIFLVLGLLTMNDTTHMLWWGHLPATAFNCWWTGGIVSVCVIIVMIILVLCGQLYESIRDNYRSKKYQKNRNQPPTPSPIKEGWKSFRGKYCSKITWN